MWIYDEKDRLVDNDLPPHLIGDEVDSAFTHIQEVYDSLFGDDGKEFRYIGFEDGKKEERFKEELSKTISLLKSKLNDEYIIESQNQGHHI